MTSPTTDRAATRLRVRAMHAPTPDRLRVLDDAELVIEDGRIAHLGPWRGAAPDADLRGGLLTPGFADAHVHLPQTHVIGSASGPLLPWLEQTTFPEEARLRDPTAAAAVAHDFVEQLHRAGTTTALVWGIPDAAATEAALDVLHASGLRGLVGPVLMDRGAPEALCTSSDVALADLDDLVRRRHDPDGDWRVVVLPRFALACSAPLLSGAVDLARRHDLRLSTHLAETTAEIAATREVHGCSDLEALRRAGWFERPRGVLAHCVHLDDAGWDLLAEGGAVVAHCPDANAFLGSGGMPLPEVARRDITLALGTDVGAGRSFHLGRVAQMAHDNALRHGVRWSPTHWFHLATAGTARALGFPDTGTLEVGMRADLVLHAVAAGTAERQLARLVMQEPAPQVSRVWMAGRVVWDEPT